MRKSKQDLQYINKHFNLAVIHDSGKLNLHIFKKNNQIRLSRNQSLNIAHILTNYGEFDINKLLKPKT